VVTEKEFQEKFRQLGTLVGELDQMPDGGTKVAARELIQLLMEVHGTGLERMMELVFESGTSGETLIARFGQDPLVRNLLLLYSLHPDDLETRLLKALDGIGPRLRKLDGQVELVGIRDGAVQLKVLTSSHGCGSTTKSLKAIVDEAVYEIAPDLTSLEIFEPEESSSGFVSLDSLMKLAPAERALQPTEAIGAD
jgi:Fe-S cluster biogenesis protein NfuA